MRFFQFKIFQIIFFSCLLQSDCFNQKNWNNNFLIWRGFCTKIVQISDSVLAYSYMLSIKCNHSNIYRNKYICIHLCIKIIFHIHLHWFFFVKAHVNWKYIEDLHNIFPFLLQVIYELVTFVYKTVSGHISITVSYRPKMATIFIEDN